ncbi:MAG TPA: NAD(P)-dependent alcohol dehydrogenase [candidate division Zixibacteria bacterium]|nr:NAD(P)-dependent alcohol dehydrogenase [candidate division Zixibacteria bacterium]
MKAMTYYKYGSPEVLQLEEIEKPSVQDDEVLIKVHAASVTPLDWHFLTGTPYIARLMAGPLKPKRNVLGTDVAGRVEAVGANFNQFQPGDEVFGLSFNNGSFAEYLCVPEEQVRLVSKPPGTSFEEAAAVPYAGFTALVCLRDLGQIQSGQKVLINGASGGVGTFAVQMAKSFGADVTGVCSTRNLDMVRSLGADQVIDYTQEDFTQVDGRYDLIFDAVRKRTFSDCKRALSTNGIYVTTELSPTLMIQKQWVSMTSSQKLVPLPLMKPDKQHMLDLRDLLETGKMKPVIDRRYQLSELPDAISYLGEGHARGKIIVAIEGD